MDTLRFHPTRRPAALVGMQTAIVVVAWICLSMLAGCAHGPTTVDTVDWEPILPEQTSIGVRDPAELVPARIPDIGPPPTVSNPQVDAPQWYLSLDEALRTALANSEVVRVLTGTSATSTGSTIYDPAIANTLIDQQQGRFDPTVQLLNSFNRVEQPQAGFDPFSSAGASIGGIRTDSYNMNLDVAQTNIAGGTASVGVNANPSRFQPGVFPLSPQTRSAVELSYTQPLLRGGGVDPNLVPIVLARIDTERSYFQFKDSLQALVQSVVEGYWAVVSARTDVWARRQQVQQGSEAFERQKARLGTFSDLADVAQARLALANFRASLVSAEANLLQREAALRNVMGLPPTDQRKLVPTTPPTLARLEFQWDELIRLAGERRPDLIELKLILEADEQQLLQANNLALPSVDAVMLYRWNGLEGTAPSRAQISSGSDQFTDWTLGVNFSVPLGLRQARAAVRQRELLLARDRANLQQGVHNAVHILGGNIRNLDQFYEQYEVFRETREAARENLNQQLAENRRGLAIFLNVLQAISSWGDAVSAEAQSLTQYNSELARLERQTGTILETHAVRFYEERFGSVGPLGRLAADHCYPSSMYPGSNADVYPDQETTPAENAFDLANPIEFNAPPEYPQDAAPPSPLPMNPLPDDTSPQPALPDRASPQPERVNPQPDLLPRTSSPLPLPIPPPQVPPADSPPADASASVEPSGLFFEFIDISAKNEVE